MPGNNRVLCANSQGSPDETRVRHGQTFGHCPTCNRILKPTPKGRLRDHSVAGKNTASLDRTYSILWI